MKRIGQAIMVAGAALLGATGIAAAQGVGVDVGPGGVYLGVNPGYHHWHDWDHSYAYSPEHCRCIGIGVISGMNGS